MAEIHKNVKTYYAKSRAAWRNWLQKNHAKEERIWLIIYRKDSGKPTLTYADSVEEALCFGWIDSKPNKRDEESFYLTFAKRNPKSKWSKLNKTRIKKLLEQGLIAEAGLQAIDTAKKSGTWEALDEVEELIVPPDLKKALSKNKQAQKHFDAFPKSVKRGILEWILNAKRKETRTKRITETVSLAEKNIRANQYTPKIK